MFVHPFSMFSFFKIMHLVVLKYKLRNKQITIEHNFIKYSFSYMFRRHGVITQLAFRTYTYRTADLRSIFLLTIPVLL